MVLGRCVRAHGVRGGLVVESYTEPPEALFGYGGLLRFADADGHDVPALLDRGSGAVRGAANFPARLPGVNDRDAAEALAGSEFFIWRDEMPPPDGGVYWADLADLVVRTESGEVLGSVAAVQDFGAGPLLEIAPPSGDGYDRKRSFYLRYGAPELVRVDLGRGEIVMRPLPWSQ